MSETQPGADSKRKKWFLLLVITGCCAGFYAAQLNRYPEAGSPLLGTWESDLGSVVNFRADGTGRSRSKSDPRIRYVEWSIDESNQLVFYERTTRGGFVAFVEQIDLMRGVARPSRIPIKVSGDGFVLSNQYRNQATGKEETSTIVFTRCEDPVLEAAK